ncbi:MAG: nitroreductase family protein [Oscillospiraceae bacterium]
MTQPQNKTVQELFERKSVRSFTSQPIAADIKEQLFNSAIQAPTAGNQVLYTILEIEDAELKLALSKTCDNQPFIAKAPLVLVFLADCRRWYNAYKAAGMQPRKPGAGDLLLACEDAMIAAQNTVVAAHSLGLGSCYIGDILENREEHVKLLHLDEYTLPICMVVYGYPTQQQIDRQKPPRFDAKYVVQRNTYTAPDEKQLREMFEGHTYGKDFDEYISAFCKRKYESEFSAEMTRSAGEYLKQFVPFSNKE